MIGRIVRAAAVSKSTVRVGDDPPRAAPFWIARRRPLARLPPGVPGTRYVTPFNVNEMDNATPMRRRACYQVR